MIPLIAAEVTATETAQIDAKTLLLVCTYSDGSRTVATKDALDRFATWSVEGPLTEVPL